MPGDKNYLNRVGGSVAELTCTVCIQSYRRSPERDQYNPRSYSHIYGCPLVRAEAWIVYMRNQKEQLQDCANNPTQPKEDWEPHNPLAMCTCHDPETVHLEGTNNLGEGFSRCMPEE